MSESGDTEEVSFQDLLEYYQDEVADKNRKLAIARAQVKKRDLAIEKLSRRLESLESKS